MALCAREAGSAVRWRGAEEWGEGRGCSSPEGSDLRVERHPDDSCLAGQQSRAGPRKAGCPS